MNRMKICYLLGAGRSVAVTASALSQVTGWTWREVQRKVRNERRSGIPIVSCKDGYYLAPTVEELDAFIERQKLRAKEVKRTADLLKQKTRKFRQGADYDAFLVSLMRP